MESEQPRTSAGALVVSCVFAVVVGGIAGLLTTLAHAAVAPWMLVAGLAIVLVLVLGFRAVFASRAVALAAAVGVVAGGALLLLPGSGPAVLAGTVASTWIWVAGVVVSGAAAALAPWPGRRSARP